MHLERDRLPDAHAGRGQQPEQGEAGRRPQRRLEPLRCGQHLAELVRRVDVGCRPPPRDGEQTGRWDLMSWVDRVQVAGKAAHRAQPVVDADRLESLGLTGPGDRQLDGHHRRSTGLEVDDEARQEPGRINELETQPPAQPQVIIEMLAQRAHRAPPVGQGRAMVRSRSTSTRA